MAWEKIPFQDQWSNEIDGNASGYVVKCYIAGTPTPTPMAIDKNGTTTIATATLNANGIPEVSGNEVVLFIDREFKIAIYENSDDAANDTNAYYGPIDNVPFGINPSVIGGLSGFSFATVAEMASKTTIGGDAITPALGDRFTTLGFLSSGVGGAEYIVTNDTPNGVNKIDLGGGFTATKIQDSRIVLEEWGLAGDGTTDDTVALNAVDSYCSGLTEAYEIVAAGIYLISPTLSTVAFGSSQARAITLYVAGSTISGGGTFKINSAVDYTSGHSNGDEIYYAAVNIRANNCSVSNIHFDGDNTHTASGYSASVVNIRWQLATCFGTSGDHYSSVSVKDCSGVDMGGQAIALQYVDNATISDGKYDEHSGLAIGPGSNPKVTGNESTNTFDAHIVVGGCTGGMISGNFCKSNTNGSGIDIIGCVRTITAGNHVEDCQGAGVWCHYFTQGSTASFDCVIEDNDLVENCRYTGSPIVGEVVLGKTNGTSNGTEVSGVVIRENRIKVDGSIASLGDRSLVVGEGVGGVVFENNKIKGTFNSSNVAVTTLYAVSGLKIAGNTVSGSTVQDISLTSLNTDVEISKNTKLKTASASSSRPDIGAINDSGEICGSIRRDLTTTAETFCEIEFLGGETYVRVNISILCNGFAGFEERTLFITGNSSGTAAVSSNVLVAQGGSATPAITVDTATTGFAKIDVAAGSGTRDSIITAKCTAVDSLANFKFNQ